MPYQLPEASLQCLIGESIASMPHTGMFVATVASVITSSRLKQPPLTLTRH